MTTNSKSCIYGGGTGPFRVKGDQARPLRKGLRQAGAALILAGALLSPVPVFGKASDGGTTGPNVEQKSAFVLISKDVPIPEAPVQDAVRRIVSIPVDRNMIGENPPAIWGNIIFDVVSGEIGRSRRQSCQWQDGKRHVVNHSWRLSGRA